RISLLFFFSSRRRHTRSKRDWSSDVCSSDLPRLEEIDVEAEPDRWLGFDRVEPGEAWTDMSVFVARLHQAELRERGRAAVEGKEIGRASCRERVWVAAGDGARREKERGEVNR